MGHDDTSGMWSLPSGVELRWQSWNADEIIVFNRASCQTHLIDAFSAVLLREIELQPRSLDDLSARLADEYDIDNETVARRIQGIFTAFEQLGLAEQDDKCE